VTYFEETQPIKDLPPFLFRLNKRIRRQQIVISAEDGLVIESPRPIREKTALNLISEQKEWIHKTWAKLQRKREKGKTLKTKENSILSFGQEKTLHIKPNQKRKYIFESPYQITIGFTSSQVSQTEAKKALKSYFMKKANTYLESRMRFFLKTHNIQINKLRIRDLKTLWGSCSENKNITLNWRLIMAPKFVSDYIICHELAHLKHLNHSKDFWEYVSFLYSDYKTAEKWLKDFGFLLKI
jgi:predicted metal-dependent hydrolase